MSLLSVLEMVTKAPTKMQQKENERERARGSERHVEGGALES